jgi:hypothetical protein
MLNRKRMGKVYTNFPFPPPILNSQYKMKARQGFSYFLTEIRLFSLALPSVLRRKNK